MVFNLCFILDPTPQPIIFKTFEQDTNVFLLFLVLIIFLLPRLFFTFQHMIHFISFNLYFGASFSLTQGDPKLMFLVSFSSSKPKIHVENKI